jgi:tetratricopeptide (TPR) repeat protein
MKFKAPGRRVLVRLALVTLTLAVYAQVYHHGFFLVDDGVYVKDNPRVQAGLNRPNIQWAFTTTAAANWHPITWLSHMLDCQVFGLGLAGHHLVNVFLHVLNVLLLFWVLDQMTGAIWPSAFVAAVFAVHPLHVESVAWISERKDVLSTFFWLLTMAAYSAYVRKPGISRYVVILPPFVLGLMTKPMLVTLPCVLLLMDYWPLGRFAVPPPVKGKAKPGFPWKALVDKAPLFGLAALSSLMTYYAQQSSGAVQTLDMLPLHQRAANAGVAYVLYAIHAVWPVNLSTYYPLAKDGLSWGPVAGSLAFLAGISWLVAWKRRDRPYLAVGWFWFLGTLVPVIGLVQVGAQAMADRYMYVPLIGLSIMVAWGVPAVIPPTRFRLPGLAAGFFSSVVILSVLCWIQVSYWGDNITLYRHEADLRPDSYFAHCQLGIALKKAGRDDEAEPEFLKTVEILPNHMDANLYLGLIAHGRKQFDQAIQRYTLALEHASGQPNRADVEINLGAALSASGRVEEAAKHYQAGIQLKPDQPEGRYNLANALAALGRRDEAVAHYREVLRLQPDNADARNQLQQLLSAGPVTSATEAKPKLETARDHYAYGNKLAEQNRFSEAAEQYQAALKLDPNHIDSRINLGNTFAARGNPREALAQYREVLRVLPNCVDALTNAGKALTELGQFTKACEEFSKALRVDPRQVDAYCSLGYALTQLNQRDEAAQAYSKALALDPSSKLAKDGLERIRRKKTSGGEPD